MTPGSQAADWRRLDDALGRQRRALLGGVVMLFLAALYVADLVSSFDRVSRGVVVAGIPLGGLDPASADQKLRFALTERTARPVTVTAEELTTSMDPAAAGLAVDWAGTLDRATEPVASPFARLGSLFDDREVDVVSTLDPGRAAAAVAPFARQVDRLPTEGTVRFNGLEPTPVLPTPGRRLEVPPALEALRTQWLSGQPVALPVAEVAPLTGESDIRNAVDAIARPAVSAPLVLVAEGARATLPPEVIASALAFRADPERGLVPELVPEVVSRAVGAQLAAGERPGRSASVRFSGGAPVVVPAEDGRQIDYPATFRNVLGPLTSGGSREVPVVYRPQPAKVTTEEISKALAAGEMSSFTTGGFAADSGRNIKRAAEMINGAVVAPGETFSLNAATNPRNAANGFVEAGIIEDGQPARGVGGGVSQVATTLYNAGYFAGMVDVEHKEHSYYISRYPVAREATVFNDVIDVKFRNDTPGPVVIRTLWTPSAVTVKIIGTKVYHVTSATGPRRDPTSPETTYSDADNCKASKGSPGFTASDTRTLRDLRTGEVRSETRTVVYQAAPNVRCGGGDDD